MQVGAQPTDSVRSILSHEGVLLKKHLLGGIRKGAFDEAVAEQKFVEWQNNKERAIQAMKDKTGAAAAAISQTRLEAEKAVNKVKAEALAKKKADLAAAAAAAAKAAEPPQEAPAEEPAQETGEK
jgi:small subunit ribosomal protein S16